MKNRVLEILQSSAGFVSGEKLSQQLGVTRAAVWKAVHALQAAGYPIEAVSNRGYYLAPGADILSQQEIIKSLDAAGLTPFINQVNYEASTDSTNRLARQASDQGAPDFSLFVAERQTAGRGRRGRAWLSDSRDGLWFSLLLRPQGETADLARITLFIGLCVAEALNTLGTTVGLKWPNDLVATGSGRKLGGILTEMTVEENTVHALIVGIGLNINTQTFTAELAGIATSLALETGSAYRRADVLAAILRVLIRRYPSYRQTDLWLPDYRRLCLTLGREIRVESAAGSWTARAVDLDEQGELVVVDTTGQRQTVRSGEVSVRGLLGFA